MTSEKAEKKTSNPTNLSRLEKGNIGVVASIQGTQAISMRLLETGFIPGTPVKMITKTPFGDPIIYELRGTQIALRIEEAVCINLE